ncbi:hypothetical protein C3Y08_23835 [Burkholderia gladioli]|uniref:hypothetical protein n=1 Tax=Burkholderia gladioli TaxID=28095 RepID=UPI000CDAA1E8|nr:hypothetical protein [Burkholderia gladioli]POS05084.1 hypothetical protein C3Y08_23835 [Burkholderia gladioli]
MDLSDEASLPWDGMRLWKGAIAERLDNETEVAATRFLIRCDFQYFVNFTHPFNAPVKERIERQLADGQLKALKTKWHDVTLPGEATAER